MERPTPRSLRSALVDGEQRLKAVGIDDARLEAEVLLRFALGLHEGYGRGGHPSTLSRAELFTRLNDPIAPDAAAGFDSILERRLAQEPTAYITGQREFYGLDFAVTPAVLIPRPETETLVECAVGLALERAGSLRVLIADVGTGSGAIAIALAHALPRAEVYATDLSSDALAIASENARRHGLQRRLTFVRGDVLSPIAQHLDLIVSNPPYVKTGDWSALPPEIRDHEPRGALDAGPEGLDVIRRILQEAPNYLRPQGALCLEFGAGQEQAVLDLAQVAFPEASRIDIRNDLGGLPRVLVVAR